MIQAHSYAAFDPKSPLQPWAFQRRDVGDDDVQIDILFCGVCHSDLHYARSEWMPVTYPQVVGHEIIGKVVVTGKNVTKHQIGDLVGVGCIADSCRRCEHCEEDLENYCLEGMQGTYMGVEKQTGLPTQGGYSTVIVIHEHNVLPEVEMTSMQDINQAWKRVEKSDVKYRFVIDMATLKDA